MHAFLYTGGSVRTRQHAISHILEERGIAAFDRLELTPHEKLSVGVADVRAFIQQLSLSPRSEGGIAGIIPEAALLTVEAQQALLKTIEEPPPHVVLYIGAGSESQLLPTIVSRCQVIPLTDPDTAFTAEELSQCAQDLQDIRTDNRGARIAAIGALGKTKDDTKRWIDCAIVTCRAALLTEATDEQRRRQDGLSVRVLLHALLEAKRLAVNNVNPTQLLEHIFLVA